MAFTTIMSRDAAQPPDLASRLLGRLYPGAPGMAGGVQPPSPTGLPISRPPSAYGPTSAFGTPGAAPTAAAAPPAPAQPQDPYSAALDPYAHWDPSQMGTFLKGNRSLNKSGPTADYARALEGFWNAQAPVDFSGEGQIGSYYDAARKRQAAIDAAMGRAGGVAGAGQSALYGREGSDIGNYVRAAIQQREQQRAQQFQNFLNFKGAIDMMQLQRDWAKQDSPGFLQSLLGTIGGVAGNALGGLNPLSFLSHSPSQVGYTSGPYGGTGEWWNNPPAWMG